MVKSFFVAFGLVDSFCLSGALVGGPVKWGEIRKLYIESGGTPIKKKIFRSVVHRLAKCGRLKVGRTKSESGLKTVPAYSLAHRKPIEFTPAKTIPLTIFLIPASLLLVFAFYLVLR